MITYVLPLQTAINLIAESALESRMGLDECIDYVSCEQFEGREWLPYKAWYSSLESKPMPSALQLGTPAMGVTSEMQFAAYCYDVEHLAHITRHAISVLAKNDLSRIEEIATALFKDKERCSQSMSLVAVASVCGVTVQTMNHIECIYVLLAYIFTQAGDIARAIDPDQLPELAELACLSHSSQFPQLLVFRLSRLESF